MENTDEQPTHLEASPKKQPTLFLILGVILLLFLVGVGGYYLGTQKSAEPIGTQPIPTFVPSPTIGYTDSVASPSPKAIIPITIPSNWKKFTIPDADFGVKTTFSLPPGFSLNYLSDFVIQNDSDATELWDYSTSIGYRDNDDVRKNHYTGGSRRDWYENYLAMKQKTFQYKDKILSVSEIPINTTSYLAITVEAPAYNTHGEISGTKKGMHYVYVQNNILHMITPASNKAYTAEAQIPKYIGTIFASLTSSQIK